MKEVKKVQGSSNSSSVSKLSAIPVGAGASREQRDTSQELDCEEKRKGKAYPWLAPPDRGAPASPSPILTTEVLMLRLATAVVLRVAGLVMAWMMAGRSIVRFE